MYYNKNKKRTQFENNFLTLGDVGDQQNTFQTSQVTPTFVKPGRVILPLGPAPKPFFEPGPRPVVQQPLKNTFTSRKIIPQTSTSFQRVIKIPRRTDNTILNTFIQRQKFDIKTKLNDINVQKDFLTKKWRQIISSKGRTSKAKQIEKRISDLFDTENKLKVNLESALVELRKRAEKPRVKSYVTLQDLFDKIGVALAKNNINLTKIVDKISGNKGVVYAINTVKMEARKAGVDISSEEENQLRKSWKKGLGYFKVNSISIIAPKAIKRQSDKAIFFVKQISNKGGKVIGKSIQEVNKGYGLASNIVSQIGRIIDNPISLFITKTNLIKQAKKQACSSAEHFLRKLIPDSKKFNLNPAFSIPFGISRDELNRTQTIELNKYLNYVNKTKNLIVTHKIEEKAKGIKEAVLSLVGKEVAETVSPDIFKGIKERVKNKIEIKITKPIFDLVTKGTGKVFNPGNDAATILQEAKNFVVNGDKIVKEGIKVASSEIAPLKERLQREIFETQKSTNNLITKTNFEIKRLQELAKELSRGPGGDISVEEKLFEARKKLARIQRESNQKISELQLKLRKISSPSSGILVAGGF